MKSGLFSLVILLALSPILGAQAIEDPGPYPVGWRDVTFVDTIYGQGTITGRMFYPALWAGENADPAPASGPYPLVAFQHGWLLSPSSYDNLCAHAASWGFVVASTGTETGLFPDHAQFGRDTRSFLAWAEAGSFDPQSWLFGMADGGDWSAVGHSMGGGVLALLIGIEPRVRTIVGLQSATVGGGAVDNMKVFTGDAFQVAGTEDWIVPWQTVYTWHENALSAPRSIFYAVEGMGHLGCTDSPSSSEPLPAAEQARLHRRLVTGLLRGEVKGEEALYVDLAGEGLEVEPVLRQTRCPDPPFWARESAYTSDSLAVGLAGFSSGYAMMAGSFASASIPTPYGELGLDLAQGAIFFSGVLSSKGWQERILPIQAAWSGKTIYFQGLLLQGGGGGMLTRVAVVPLP